MHCVTVVVSNTPTSPHPSSMAGVRSMCELLLPMGTLSMGLEQRRSVSIPDECENNRVAATGVLAFCVIERVYVASSSLSVATKTDGGEEQNANHQPEKTNKKMPSLLPPPKITVNIEGSSQGVALGVPMILPQPLPQGLGFDVLLEIMGTDRNPAPDNATSFSLAVTNTGASYMYSSLVLPILNLNNSETKTLSTLYSLYTLTVSLHIPFLVTILTVLLAIMANTRRLPGGNSKNRTV